jgi:primase-polymerase (primpol)-like protein
MMQASTAVNPPIPENIPEQLTERPQWVCWRLEERDGNMTKVPYTPGTVRRASSIDLMTWRSFTETVGAYERSEPPYDGIGFVFCSADPYSGIDLDKCRDPETGVIEQWARKIIDSIQEGYVEVSPSGTGVHIILEGVVRGGAVKKGSIEMYSQTRFFTVTGRVL